MSTGYIYCGRPCGNWASTGADGKPDGRLGDLMTEWEGKFYCPHHIPKEARLAGAKIIGRTFPTCKICGEAVNHRIEHVLRGNHEACALSRGRNGTEIGTSVAPDSNNPQNIGSKPESDQ